MSADGRTPGEPIIPPGGRLLGGAAEKAQEISERQAGMRCGGCKRRIGLGLEFVSFRAAQVDGVGVMQTMRTYACARPDCDYAEKVAKEALVMRQVEWVWLRDPLDKEGEFEPKIGNLRPR